MYIFLLNAVNYIRCPQSATTPAAAGVRYPTWRLWQVARSPTVGLMAWSAGAAGLPFCDLRFDRILGHGGFRIKFGRGDLTYGANANVTIVEQANIARTAHLKAGDYVNVRPNTYAQAVSMLGNFCHSWLLSALITMFIKLPCRPPPSIVER